MKYDQLSLIPNTSQPPVDVDAFVGEMVDFATTPGHRQHVAAAYDRESERLGLLETTDESAPVIDDPELNTAWHEEQAAKAAKFGRRVVDTASLTSAQQNKNERTAIAKHHQTVVKQVLDR